LWGRWGGGIEEGRRRVRVRERHGARRVGFEDHHL
jgi:hypothetical protein